MNKRVVISRDNYTGSMRKTIAFNKSENRISGNELNIGKPYCSIDNDNITTYVQKQVWGNRIFRYIYPPYVECEYVE